jgi:hypothetical protein
MQISTDQGDCCDFPSLTLHSLPSMVTPDDPSVGVRKAPDLPSIVLPLQRGNVKFLSFGHVNPKALAGAVCLFSPNHHLQCILILS